MQHKPDRPDQMSKGHPVRDQNEDRGPEIDSELQAHIGRHLKASYDDILGQDVPDRFMELLQQLEARETNSKAKDGDE